MPTPRVAGDGKNGVLNTGSSHVSTLESSHVTDAQLSPELATTLLPPGLLTAPRCV